MSDLISRQAAINMLDEQIELCEKALYNWLPEKDRYAVKVEKASLTAYREKLKYLPSAQPDTEKICARIKAEALKRNVEYMKHGDRYMLGFVDGMRLARRIVDGTVDDPVYFTTSGE